MNLNQQRAVHGRVRASPATRFLAKQKGIDLAIVPPTAKGGRVSKVGPSISF